MNILREVRKVQQKSFATRIRLLLSFSVIFIVTTYAWLASDKDVALYGLTGDVTSWDVYYYVKSHEDENLNQVLNEISTFTITDLYPGMPDREDVVHIRNIGTASTKIRYDLISVKVFGQEVLDELEIEQKEVDGKTTFIIFGGDTSTNADGTAAYPFNISYTYDRDKLTGTYAEDGSNPNGESTFKFNVSWTYEDGDTDAEIEAKDVLDTKFGKDAYAYYQDAANDPTKAIEIKVKITSSMIHPDLDT